MSSDDIRGGKNVDRRLASFSSFAARSALFASWNCAAASVFTWQVVSVRRLGIEKANFKWTYSTLDRLADNDGLELKLEHEKFPSELSHRC